MIDIKGIKYKVLILLADGNVLNFTNILTDLSWDDQKDELAQKATITIPTFETKWGYTNNLVKLCTQVYILADEGTGAGFFECMRGSVWDWDYQSSSSGETVSIMVYDHMIFGNQSKDHAYFSKGRRTQSVVTDICKKWGIPLSYTWSSITHGKLVFKSENVSDQIKKVLDEAKAKIYDNGYVAGMREGTLTIKPKGSNQTVYCFVSNQNVIRYQNRLTLSNLITKVIILGKEDKAGRAPVEATLFGDTSYGTIQDIVNRDSDTSIAEAKKEGQKILDEKGKPEETIHVEAMDVPSIRKGDKIKLTAGNVSDYFFIQSVTHMATSKTMAMDLERVRY